VARPPLAASGVRPSPTRSAWRAARRGARRPATRLKVNPAAGDDLIGFRVAASA